MSNTAHPFWSPIVVTYAVCDRSSVSTLYGFAATSTAGGAVVGQPLRCAALQRRVSSMETLVPLLLGT